jgi:hypothetical protein
MTVLADTTTLAAGLGPVADEDWEGGSIDLGFLGTARVCRLLSTGAPDSRLTLRYAGGIEICHEVGQSTPWAISLDTGSVEDLSTKRLLALRDALNQLDLAQIAALSALPVGLAALVAQWKRLPYRVMRGWIQEHGWGRWMELSDDARAALVEQLAPLSPAQHAGIAAAVERLRADPRIPPWARATVLLGLAEKG